MKIDEISQKLKELRLTNGYSLDEISAMIPVSKQGYHYWEQGMRTWKLDVLAQLSEILNFELTIKNGTFEFSSETSNMKNESQSKTEKGEIKMKKIAEWDGYSVVELYTTAENINFEEQSILEKLMVYSSKEELQNYYYTDQIVPVYALYDEETSNIVPNTEGLTKTRAYSFYYWNFAPILDDSNTIYIDIKKDIKIMKQYAKIDFNHPNSDGSYPILDIQTQKDDKLLGVFMITNMMGLYIKQIECLRTDFPVELIP